MGYILVHGKASLENEIYSSPWKSFKRDTQYSLEMGYMLVNIKKASKWYTYSVEMGYMLVNLKPSRWDAR